MASSRAVATGKGEKPRGEGENVKEKTSCRILELKPKKLHRLQILINRTIVQDSSS